VYTIIGGDGKEYGPMDSDDVLQWIREGRVNSQTMLKREGETNWRPVPTYTEFASAMEGTSLSQDDSPPRLPEAQPISDDGLTSIIPYNNKEALWGYYMSILGLLIMCIPIVGLIYGIVVLRFGLAGLKNAQAKPEIKGKFHCWIAIIGGFVELVVGGFTSAGLVIGLFQR